MKRIFPKLLLLLLLISTNQKVYADPNSKKNLATKKKVPKKAPDFKSGSIYVLSSGKSIPVLYTRSYSKPGKKLYTTTYNVYNESRQRKVVVIAVHNKEKHTVEVSVRDFELKGFPVVNSEQTTYSVPYMGRFGAIGKVGAIGKGKSRTSAPGQLTVKFVSKKYDYLKVVHIADAHEDSGKELQVYVLDEAAQ